MKNRSGQCARSYLVFLCQQHSTVFQSPSRREAIIVQATSFTGECQNGGSFRRVINNNNLDEQFFESVICLSIDTYIIDIFPDSKFVKL